MSGRGYISPEAYGKCEYCGKIAEMRPYGKNGEKICFECGTKDEEITEKKMSQVLFGEGLDS